LLKTGKKVLVVAMVFMVGLFLTGCSRSGSNTTASAITLYWWRPMDDASSQTLQQVADSFNQTYKNIKVQVVLKDPRTYEQEANDAMAGHQSIQNSPDILAVRADDMSRYASKLNPAPDTLFDQLAAAKTRNGQNTAQYVQKLFLPVVNKAVTFKDSSGSAKVMGLPMAVDELALYRNTDLIQQSVENLTASNKVSKSLGASELTSIKKKINAPVGTWQDLTDIVPYLTLKSGNEISQSAIALGTSVNVERSYDILSSLMMQNGTKMTDDSLTSAAFNLQQPGAAKGANPGLEAFNFYLRFSNPSDALYTWNNQMQNSVDAFENGQVAMMIHYASIYRYLVNDAPELKKSLDVTPLPQVADPQSPTSTGSLKTMANMLVETVPSARADTARQNAAWTFVHYVTSKAGAQTYLSAMKLPSALNDVSGKAKFDAFNTQTKDADIWYKGNSAGKINELFINMVNEAVTNVKSPKDALDAAATQATSFIKASQWKWATVSQ